MFDRIASQFDGCTAVVIGTGGIGGAIINLLNGRCRHLIAGDRSDDALQGFRSLTGTSTVRHSQIVDVTGANSVASFFSFVKEQAGAPHFVFYTAGILNIETLAATTPELWDRAVDVNLNGAFYTVHSAVNLMRPARRGSILLLSSIAGIRARSGSRVNPVYNATKAAISALVNSSAMQLRSDGIRINCISPGPTATAMMDLQPRHVHDAVAQITLDGRQNNPVEVAELALFVAAHGRFTGEDVALGGGAGLGG
jgi:NAD(P)-dependent dehydrogenase (short-subunit alcohol dehydrogenase family)